MTLKLAYVRKIGVKTSKKKDQKIKGRKVRQKVRPKYSFKSGRRSYLLDIYIIYY
jgi:hypothetical protein